MGYSPWGHKESDTTESLIHSACRGSDVMETRLCLSGIWGKNIRRNRPLSPCCLFLRDVISWWASGRGRPHWLDFKPPLSVSFMALGSEGGPGEGILVQDFVFTQKKKKKKENPLSLCRDFQRNPMQPTCSCNAHSRFFFGVWGALLIRFNLPGK